MGHQQPEDTTVGGDAYFPGVAKHAEMRRSHRLTAVRKKALKSPCRVHDPRRLTRHLPFARLLRYLRFRGGIDAGILQDRQPVLRPSASVTAKHDCGG